MQKYRQGNRALPFHTRATCPHCRHQVEAFFARNAAGQIVLTFLCACCGHSCQVHHDSVWTQHQPDRPFSAAQTYSGLPIQPNLRDLPRTVETLCPECSAVVVGRYFVEDQAVMIEKFCPEHGYVRDCVNRDVRLFLKAASWSFDEQPGLLNAHKPAHLGCPSDCGLCGRHQSSSCLANIDLTNRCNLNCPICFANANVVGYVYEPSFEQLEAMMQALRDLRPTPATAVQFSGGEPTIHPRFHDIVRRARAMGFSNIQIATNGLKMADYDFAARAKDAGLHTLYLQFDGIGPDIYLKTRGRDIWNYKLQALENCRKLDLKICLVPTIIRTVNDDAVGPIFRFAVDNIDVVSGISYQPVCFTGRIDEKLRMEQRYTLGDLARDLARETGASVTRDFYPLSVVMPISQILEVVTGQPKIKASCHTDCAFGSYFLIDDQKNVHPFPKVLDIEALFTGMNRYAHQWQRRAGHLNWFDKFRLYRMFKSAFRPDSAPPGLTLKSLVQAMQGMVDKNRGRGQSGKNNYRTLMAAGMHFQDRYNYDVQRVRRCVIPYSTPAGIVPFCAYNGGPTYRPFIERMYAQPNA